MASFKENLINCPVEYGISWLVILSALVFAIMLLYFCAADKPFQGYYLDHSKTDGYCVYKNWKNWPDEKAYCSYEGNKALIVFKKLKDMDKK